MFFKKKDYTQNSSLPNNGVVYLIVYTSMGRIRGADQLYTTRLYSNNDRECGLKDRKDYLLHRSTNTTCVRRKLIFPLYFSAPKHWCKNILRRDA